MKRLFALVLTLGLMAGVAYAHKGMEHVMGTVASITDTSITVTTMDGKTQTVNLTSDTKYAKMDNSITAKDIKVGDHVVIHATKKDNQLTAAIVKVGMGKVSGMKMDSKSSSPSPQPK
jgi:hypothetical protein